ncbi:MAG: YqgE/AlgH family protein [Magnetococcales bacterium]|nr:YqgE/AlgH family protein [Magnetococcales bacterium]
MKVEEGSLAGKFLVAMPGLKDPNFERAVIFVCAHSPEGALGLVINQPHSISLDEILDQLCLTWERSELPLVYQGGPVSPDRGFVLFETPVEIPGHMEITPGLFLGTNPDLLKHFGEADNSSKFLFVLGYAGWGDGQLETELRENVWLIGDFDRSIVFDLPPAMRWTKAIQSMGIDITQLVEAGRALN